MGRPELIVFRTIEPLTKSGQEKLDLGLEQLGAEDRAFRFTRDLRTGETHIYGVDEMHLDGIADRLTRDFGVEAASIGNPQIVHRETIRKVSEAEGKFVRQTGGRSEYGHVILRLAPRETGTGFEFINGPADGKVPEKFIKPVEQGIREAMASGILAGYQMVDIQATLCDASYHEADSSEMAFKMAASEAFREAARQASPVLLEPILAVEVMVPDIYLGPVVGDLCYRGARIEAIERREGTQAIMATVPLSRMLGYGGDLASRTEGRGTYSAQFDRYVPLPDGGMPPNDQDGGSPVAAPRTPAPRGRYFSVALPEPDEDDCALGSD
jgi:elongation factor G